MTWHLLSQEEKDLLKQECAGRDIWQTAVRLIRERDRLKEELNRVMAKSVAYKCHKKKS